MSALLDIWYTAALSRQDTPLPPPANAQVGAKKIFVGTLPDCVCGLAPSANLH